jgi:hypothetical protein
VCSISSKDTLLVFAGSDLVERGFGPSGKTRQRQKLSKGPENIGSAKIGKNRQNSANIKKYIIYSFFFKILNIFQYIKQQQHHINR